MTEQHPITPPPELVEEWRNLPEYVSQLRTMSTVTITTERLQDIATQAARWGADQELEACCHQLRLQGFDLVDDLRVARRPKPPSLKEQALAVLEEEPEDSKELIVFDTDQVNIIRRALEQLDD